MSKGQLNRHTRFHAQSVSHSVLSRSHPALTRHFTPPPAFTTEPTPTRSGSHAKGHSRTRTHKTLDRECVNTCTLTKVGHYSMLHSDMRSRHMLEVWPHLMLHYVVRMLSLHTIMLSLNTIMLVYCWCTAVLRPEPLTSRHALGTASSHESHTSSSTHEDCLCRLSDIHWYFVALPGIAPPRHHVFINRYPTCRASVESQSETESIWNDQAFDGGARSPRRAWASGECRTQHA